MRHLPERHQSIAPPPAVLLSIAGVIVLLGIVWVVVALAE